MKKLLTLVKTPRSRSSKATEAGDSRMGVTEQDLHSAASTTGEEDMKESFSSNEVPYKSQPIYLHIVDKWGKLKAEEIDEDKFVTYKFLFKFNFDTAQVIKQWRNYCQKDKGQNIDIFVLKEKRVDECHWYKPYIVVWNCDSSNMDQEHGKENAEGSNFNKPTPRKLFYNTAGAAAIELARRLEAARAKVKEVNEGKSSREEIEAAVAELLAGKKTLADTKNSEYVTLGCVHMPWGPWSEHTIDTKASDIYFALDNLKRNIKHAIKNGMPKKWMGIPMSSLEFYRKP